MRKLAVFTLGFAFSAALYVYFRLDTPALVGAGACLFLSFLTYGRKNLWLRRIAICALGAALAVVWCFVYQHTILGPIHRAVGTEGIFTMQITERPWQNYDGIAIEGKLYMEGRPFPVLLYGEEDLLEAEPGDYVTCAALAQPTTWERNCLSQGIVMKLSAKGPVSIVPGQPSWPCRVRLWLQEKIDGLYNGQTAALLKALLTGERSELTQETQWDLKSAGLYHAVAVSGMHVSILLALAALLCGRNPRLTAILGIPLLLFFTLMTGASPSVCRAAVMQTILLLAPLAGREHDPPTSLSFAGLVLLLQNPWVTASVSFQLSFAAVGGLCFFSGRMEQKLLRGRRRPSWLRRAVVSGITATMGASILTIPLMVLYFGMISVIAPLTNLLCLWAVTAIFALGLLSCILGPVGAATAWVASRLTDYVLWFCGKAAALPFTAASTSATSYFVWALCAYAAAFWLLLRKKKGTPSMVLAALTLGFLAAVSIQRWTLLGGEFCVTALNVGQGQCIMLESGGVTAMVDCGGSCYQPWERPVQRFRSAGLTRLDLLILSHYDWDHAGGIPMVLHCLQVENLFLPDVPDRTGIREEIESAAQKAGTTIHYVRETTTLETSGLELVLFPPIYGENSNDKSIPVLATAAEYVILIPGDLSDFGEMKLLSAQDLPQVDLLVAGHHGAKNAVTQTLLDAVSPETVWISVGADNIFGHPNPETLARIQDAGATVCRTDLQGDLLIRK